VTNEIDIEKSIGEFHEVMVLACRESFRTRWASKKANSNKAVPWRTEELTIMRKRINALRRKYQMTRNNEDLREQYRSRYLTGKARYTAKIKKDKVTSWKEYCNMTSSINPWKEVYKLAACKRKNNTQITTLRKPDGILTADIRENLSTCWSILHWKIKKLMILTTINSSGHKLKISRTRLMAKTSPHRKLELQWKAWE
jgi:hypothetical protein